LFRGEEKSMKAAKVQGHPMWDAPAAVAPVWLFCFFCQPQELPPFNDDPYSAREALEIQLQRRVCGTLCDELNCSAFLFLFVAPPSLRKVISANLFHARS
jgi:hypothetical protein